MRLGIKDHKVLRAFVERRSASGHKLSTDGKRLDGHWLGGSRIAEWTANGIRVNDLGSKAAQSVQRALKGHAAPTQFESYRPSKRLRAGVSYGTRSRDASTRKSVGPRVGMSLETRLAEHFDVTTRQARETIQSTPNGRKFWTSYLGKRRR